MPYVFTRDGAKLYYETVGQGTPIIFIHPPAMGHVTFMKQRVLREQFQLIFIDMRGNGKSSSGKEKVSIELLASDVKTVLDELEIDKTVLFGYSNGGTVVLHFALAYPERTLGIISSGSFPIVNSFLLKNEFRLGIATTHLKAMQLLATVLAKAHFYAHEKREMEQLQKYILKAEPHTIRDTYIAGMKYDCTKWLHQMNVPVRLMYGGRAFYLHNYWQLFYEKVKNLDVIFIEKAPHQIPTKYALECNHLIAKFIKEKIE